MALNIYLKNYRHIMKYFKIAYFIKDLYILPISVTVAEVLGRKAFLFTLCGIFFLHSFSLVVNGEGRSGQENYFLKCK